MGTDGHLVELTFVDEMGKSLPPLRRSQSRSAQGKLREVPPDLSVLGVDPIAVRIGTIMPGLLPLIKVGSESELGRAVSQLTGLSALIDLAEHVRRAKNRVKEFTKAKTDERERVDKAYNMAKNDLENLLQAHPAIAPATTVPPPSKDKAIEGTLATIIMHYEDAKAAAFDSARNILGTRFDPADPKLISDLEKNIGRALERASLPAALPSAARLNGLRALNPDQLGAADAKIVEIRCGAEVLARLAQNPSTAARTRLYARVVTWIEEHPDPQRREDVCVVCGGPLNDMRDPVTKSWSPAIFTRLKPTRR
jgi:hypothetical protein